MQTFRLELALRLAARLRVGEHPKECNSLPEGCKEDTNINPFGCSTKGCKEETNDKPSGYPLKYWNCVDLEYEFETRQGYMSYGESRYPHALDAASVGLAGLSLPYRMSARDIFTYGAQIGFQGEPEYNNEPPASRERDPLHGAGWSTMLPCRGERGVGRSCYNMKATKYEWLLGAMYQSHVYPNNDLVYGKDAANEGGKTDRPEETWHPLNAVQSEDVRDQEHSMHGPKDLFLSNRVFLWDVDQTWSFNPNAFAYFGAELTDDGAGYLDGFKDILHNERVTDKKFDFNHFPTWASRQ